MARARTGKGTFSEAVNAAEDVLCRQPDAEGAQGCDLLRNVLQSMPDIVFYKDTEGVYLGCNQLFAEFVGHPVEEIVGRSDDELFDRQVAEAFREMDRGVLASCSPMHTEEWITYRDGRRALVDTFKTPLRDARGKVVGLLGVSRDITEKARLQEELIHERDKADQNAKLKAAFLADMSHEIRTPLNVILGYLQIMDRECIECPQKRSIRAMSKSGEHLLGLVNDILGLIQRDSRNMPLSESAFDLFQMIEDIRAIFERQAQTRALKIETSCAEGVPRYVHADKGKIRQVLLNLVGNAMKVTEQGFVHVRLGRADAVSAEGSSDQKHRLIIDVENSGCGIPEGQREAVFETFFKADAESSQKNGSGLGFPLCRRYAQALGGDVTVMSREGQGSVFRFVFCVRGEGAASAEEMGRIRLRVRPADGEVPRVLIVDDNPAGRDVQVVMLETAGFTVDVAESGERALACLQGVARYQVVLLDKRMPGMDGLETLKRIRALPDARGVPVILMTVSGFSDESDTIKSLGGDGLLPRPVSFERMLQEIGRVTGCCYDRIDEAGMVSEESESHSGDGAAEAAAGPSSVPDTLRSRMQVAVRCGDVTALRALVSELRSLAPDVALAVERMVDAYDYDGLRRFLRRVETETRVGGG